MMKAVACGGKQYIPSKIVCVGRNFADHIAEIGGGELEHPAIFLKPNSSVAFGVKEIAVPSRFGLLHHEVELCFIAGESEEEIIGYGVGVDLTLRDVQSEAKARGMPWTLAKGFDNAAVLGRFVPQSEIDHPMNLDISLSVNGEVRQKSNTGAMIFKPREILSYSSEYMTIEGGDVFMCGTPSGVGPLVDGDRIQAEISGLPVLDVVLRRRN